MTEQHLVQRGGTLTEKPPLLLIRNSTALAEIATPTPGSRWQGTGTFAKVHCGSCDHRLFDVHSDHPHPDENARFSTNCLIVERKCPKCAQLNEGCVTSEDGRSFSGPKALAGPWLCECGRSLGYVADIRGRIFVTCRCKVESRVVAAEVIAIVDCMDR